MAVVFVFGNKGYMRINGSERFLEAINGVVLDDAVTIVNIAIPKLGWVVAALIAYY